jgi:molecular chaperone DnaK (HSP70)
LIAEMGEAGLRVFPAVNGQRSTPSVVLLNGDDVVVGDEAKRAAPVYPDRAFAFFKRDMGVDGASRTVDGRAWSPAELSSRVLTSLLDDAERATGQRPEEAVITVPAYFGDGARRATVEAGELAGLDVLELIHEPTAAALAFGFGGRNTDPQTVLVYDLGGGTFDVSIVRVGESEMRVLGTDGDHELGGKDWDDILIGMIADKFSERHDIDPRMDLMTGADLRARCEDAKRTLSQLSEATVSVVAEGVSDRITVTREEFELMTGSLMAATERLLSQVVSDAGMTWNDLTATVLVGGSTRMPACARLVERVSGKPPTRGIDPDSAVVHGAALVAQKHAPARSGPSPMTGLMTLPKVCDVTAHALGFVVVNEAGDRYVNEVMIQRNSTIPAALTKVKRLERGTDELDVYLLQGHQERPLAAESLGRYRFSNVPEAQSDRDVQITFMYDADGIVRVKAAVRRRELPVPQHDPADKDLSWTDEDPRDHNRSCLDAVLLIDCSISMSGAKLTEAKESCVEFAEILGDLNGARVGLVSFADGARIEAGLTEDGRSLVSAARGLSLYGGTDLASGLQTAATVFDSDTGHRVVVVLTDGAPNSKPAAASSAAALVDRGIEIVTVGVQGADMGFLASIATADRDSLFTDDMRGTLRSIARSLAGGMTRSA